MSKFYIQKWGGRRQYAIIASLLIFTFVCAPFSYTTKKAEASLSGGGIPSVSTPSISSGGYSADPGGGLKTPESLPVPGIPPDGGIKDPYSGSIAGSQPTSLGEQGRPEGTGLNPDGTSMADGSATAGAGGATTPAKSVAGRAAQRARAGTGATNTCKPGSGATSGGGMPVHDVGVARLICGVQVNAQQINTNTKKVQVNTKKSAAMNTITAKKTSSLERKEYILDGILHSIIKKIVQQLIKSALQWVKSGFKGSPMFVTNPEQFLLSAGDQVANEFINGGSLNSSCNPMNVRSALNNYYRSSTGRATGAMNPMQCSLSGSLRSLGGGGGGWSNWLSGATSPQNSMFGSAFMAQGQLDNAVATRQASEKMKWDWGKGFLPKENCTTVGGAKTCSTLTPGETIAQDVNFNVSTGKRELIQADEINEVISALLSQLSTQVLSGAGGLFGLGSASQGSGYSSSLSKSSASRCEGLSYLDRIGNPQCDGDTDGANQTSANAAQNSGGMVSDAVLSERNYQSINQPVLTQTTQAIAEAQSRGASCGDNPNVIADLQNIQTIAQTTMNISKANEQVLLTIQAQYNEGTPESQSSAMSNFETLNQGGQLNTDVNNALVALSVEDVLAMVQTLSDSIVSCGGGNRVVSDPVPTN